MSAVARGQSAFQPEALISEVPPLSDLASTPEAALDAYRAFYGFCDPPCHRIGWMEAAGERIVVQTFTPENARGTALVCHGYYDHVGLYVYLIRYLLGEQLNVVAFDFPGHGLSSGERATIDSFDRYVEVLRAVRAFAMEALPPPHHIVAQSMGGAITMEYLVGDQPAPTGEVVLLAPLVRPYAWAINRWVFALARRLIKERKRTITNNAENPEFLALQHRDPLQAQVLPVQWVAAMVAWMQRFESSGSTDYAVKVIQGYADRTVDWQYNLKVVERLFRASVLHIPEARHHLVNESDRIRTEMWSWLSEHCEWQG